VNEDKMAVKEKVPATRGVKRQTKEKETRAQASKCAIAFLKGKRILNTQLAPYLLASGSKTELGVPYAVNFKG